MADNKLTRTNSRWLYETAAAATPTAFSGITDGYTWSDDGRVLRVTADEAQFGSTAYVLQRTNESGDYEDAVTITLDLPTGSGHTRTDVFTTSVVSGSPDYTTLASLGLVDQGNAHAAALHAAQVELESENGLLFDYAGNKFRGTRTVQVDTKEKEFGGFMPESDLTILTSRKQWHDAGVMPAKGVSVKVGGATYKIQAIDKNEPTFGLSLILAHRGN